MSGTSRLDNRSRLHHCRECWLAEAIEMFREWFRSCLKQDRIPQYTRASLGWPSGANSLGECFPPILSQYGETEIFISPSQHTAMGVLDILAHELAHAAAGWEAHHDEQFLVICDAVGLTEGMPGQRSAGALLIPKLYEIEGKLGPFPHSRLERGGRT